MGNYGEDFHGGGEYILENIAPPPGGKILWGEDLLLHQCIQKKYFPVCISPYLGQICHMVDNKDLVYNLSEKFFNLLIPGAILNFARN